MPDPLHRPAYVVLGARGQLAQAFLAAMGEEAEGWDRAHFDFAHPAELAAALRRAAPRVVVNCAAFNQVDLAETQRQNALEANAEGPAALAHAAEQQGWRLVHFSTDYVFGADGLDRARTEADPPAPLNFYGYSKLLGEEGVLRTSPRALVLRVAHLFGGKSLSPGRANLVERFLQQARSGQPILLTLGQMLNPTSVQDIVRATLGLLKADAFGLFHLTGEGSCTAEEFAREALRLAGLGDDAAEFRIVERDSRPAPRARNTVLENRRLRELGFPAMPHWRTALAGVSD